MPRTTTNGLASQVIGEAIRRIRLEVGLTQGQLAERMQTTVPYVSALENGRSNPTIGQIWAIADALRVEVEVDFRVPARQPTPTIPKPPAARRSRARGARGKAGARPSARQ